MKSRIHPVFLGLCLAASTHVCAAQVGYPPDHSPYQDVRAGGTTLFGYGYIGGTRGVVGVGPSAGQVYSARYEVSFGRMFGIHVEVADATTTRYLVDPTKGVSTRMTGPVDNSLTLAQVGAQVLLTGGKSWHGLAPYIGASVGAAYAGTLPADTSQYKFGAKVIFGPEVGVRWYLTRRLAMRFDTKMIFWKLSYPLEYRVPPTTCTGGTDCTALVGVSDPLTEWTHHFWFNVRVGWTF